jgi:hypothetical protein
MKKKSILFILVPGVWIGIAVFRAWLSSRDVTGLPFGTAFSILIKNPFHRWN